jgi:hypothetical protein
VQAVDFRAGQNFGDAQAEPELVKVAVPTYSATAPSMANSRPKDLIRFYSPPSEEALPSAKELWSPKMPIG